MEQADISAGVEMIGGKAFYLCGSLKRISVPDSVRTIGEQAFYGCASLESVELPASVVVAPDAFENCPARITYRN